MAHIFYAVELIMLAISSMIAFTHRKNEGLHPIRFYLLFGLVDMIVFFLIPVLHLGAKFHIIQLNIGTMLDLNIFYYYFFKQNTFVSHRSILLACYLAICSIALYYWFGITDGFKQFNSVLFGIENLFITVPCLLYLYSLFQTEDNKDLKHNPYFIITCGILFYHATTFPFYISYKTLIEISPQINMILNSINSLLTTLMLISFIKAFLCPYPAVK